MRNIGIIDAELIYLKKHTFPNLASMKISGYHKSIGDKVSLLLDYSSLHEYDIVYISKVFTDTVVPEKVLSLENVKYGGTGFFYDKAEPLPYEVEHSFPDYDLYSQWVEEELKRGKKRSDLKYYLDYSIGFTTRGCFRQCGFCVNKNFKKVIGHSPLSEFLDVNRKYICLLDDNILGFKDWKKVFEDLNATGKKFEYRQGMDERTLTDEKCEVLLDSNYHGDYVFAFDSYDDKDLIISKLRMWNKHRSKRPLENRTMFYVLVGYDKDSKYDDEFWERDLKNTFERIKILMTYGCNIYIMRYFKYKESPYAGVYTNIARWCNQFNIYKRKSYREFCEMDQLNTKKIPCASMARLYEIQEKFPEIADRYYDLKFIKNKYEGEYHDLL